ncbi:lysosome-associated membrane glycoprotein 1-like [Limulus polyphemus]|uniref:Lysosome-associated membrane glycoprotein 5 n=1 Tax=Limulus polyphemus TaxID=6850 RepID=A0ABM1BC97_LIMPO|nr:lysosome-associated membrane glycoprotein 1-like [Limulus polyphemus]
MKLKVLEIILLSLLAVSSVKAQENDLTTDSVILSDLNTTHFNESTTTLLPSTSKNGTESTTTLLPSTSKNGTESTTTLLPSTSKNGTETPISSSTSAPSGKWIVEDENKTCIILTMDASFNIKYNKTGKSIGTGKLDVPKNASVDTGNSTCSGANYTQIIVLVFNGNSLMMTFANTDKTVSVTKMKLNYILDSVNFPNASEPNAMKEVKVSETLFKVDQGKGYVCNKAENIDFNLNVTMTVSKLQVEAFRTDNSSYFTEDIFECVADDDISDIVPIAVGCALAGLVLIVLIAYIVGRHRNHQKSYQSM